MKGILKLSVLLAANLGLPLYCQSAEPVRLSGAAAVCAALVAVKADVEKAAGETITLTSKNAGKGLQDLCAGSCDIAMVSGSMEKAAAGANEEKPGSIDLSTIKAVLAGKDPILFVVHPSNPVNSLTFDQIKAILTGTIRNWKEVGGPDAVMDVFTLGARNGPRIAVDEQVLAGAAMARSAIQRETPKDICPIVAQKPNGFGFLGRSNLGAGVKILKTDKEAAMSVFLATKGEPTPDAAKVIQAAKTIMER